MLLEDMPHEVRNAAWSKDGSAIFFTANTGVRSELFKVDVASEALTQLTQGDHSLSNWQYVPDLEKHIFGINEPTNAGDVHSVAVDGFWISPFPVTNDEFDRFVQETSHVTVAERPLDPTDFPGAPPENLVPGSLVFTMTPGPVDLRHMSRWWTWTPGACWRQPEGPHSSLDGRGEHPVVHVAYEDAEAYATLAGRALPTEAEWELAARGGLDGAAFVWGDEQFPNGKPLANWWQGDFPWRNSHEDGFEGDGGPDPTPAARDKTAG